MQRRHLAIPAILLAASALVGARGVLAALPLGPDAPEAATAEPASTAQVDQQVAERTAALDVLERRIDAAAARRPPRVEDTPSGSASSGSIRTATRSRSAVPGGGRGAVRPAGDDRSGHGGSGRDHPEDDSNPHHEEAGDDHGGDRGDRDDRVEAGDDRGGGVEAGDDHGGHGGDDGGSSDDD